MFIAPIPATTLISFGDKRFRKMTDKSVDACVNVYPLDHTKWIEA